MDANSSWDNTTCDPSTLAYRPFGAFLGGAVSVLGTAGNGLTLMAYVADSRLRTNFNLLILNLTLADLAYCGLLQPVAIHTYLQGSWGWGRDVCRAFGLAVFTLNLVSILSMALVAGSRYVLVARPQAFRRAFSGWSLALWLALPWLLSVACLAPFWSLFRFVPAVCTCSFHRTEGRPYTTILHSLTFGLGLASIAAFYLLIRRHLRRASRALSGYGGPGGPGKAGGEARKLTSRGGGGRRSSRPGRDGDFRRVTAMCFAMFVVYLGCYLPFCALHLLEGVAPAQPLAQMVVGNLTWLNGALNPLLYAALNRQFRRGYWVVLRCGRLGGSWGRSSSDSTGKGGGEGVGGSRSTPGLGREEESGPGLTGGTSRAS